MTHSPARRPRFERAAVAGIKLTPRDLLILRAVHRHRLLRSTHLIALLDASPQTTLRRLQLLFHHGYLDRPAAQLDWYAQGSEPLVYALGNRGAAVLAAEGERGGAQRWETNRNVSRQFLRHTLAVAEVMVAFEVACHDTEGAQFIRPEEILAGAPEATRRLRLPFRWQVEVSEGEKLHQLGVEPDRIFGLSFAAAPEQRRLAYFFLEADRGTMPVMRQRLEQTSFRRKLLGYRETWRQELHRTHLGLPNFRVLTVTTNQERMRHLVTACRSLGTGGRLFLFAHQAALQRGNVLGQVWVNGFGEMTHLLP
jgi:DNA-binding Lrp family transcriptional regulator